MRAFDIERKVEAGCRGFLNDLDVRWLPAEHKWELLEDLVWVGELGNLIVVPKGFRTDFASTPRILQNLFPPTGAWTKAAVVHDFLCDGLNERHRKVLATAEAHEISMSDAENLVPRCAFGPVDTDNVFRLIMLQEGTSERAAQFGWVGVRYGAMANKARRPGSISTLGEVARTSAGYLFLAWLACALFAAVVLGVWTWLV